MFASKTTNTEEFTLWTQEKIKGNINIISMCVTKNAMYWNPWFSKFKGHTTNNNWQWTRPCISRLSVHINLNLQNKYANVIHTDIWQRLNVSSIFYITCSMRMRWMFNEKYSMYKVNLHSCLGGAFGQSTYYSSNIVNTVQL